MKALVPFNKVEVLHKYVEAGAGEFYLGFTDANWFERFGKYSDINRLSGYRQDANQNTLERIIPIIKRVKDLGRMIYITFNASTYTQEQLDYIGEHYLDTLRDAGADGIIVSNIELVKLAVKYQIPAVVSTIAGIYNEDIAKYYYEAGAKRMILPRDLSVAEIGEITKAVPEAEYEVFMMRNGCAYSDGNCLGFHRLEKSGICAAIGNAEKEIQYVNSDFKEKHDMELTDFLYHQMFHRDTCGICSIYQFVKMGITAGKIVGRTDEWEEVCKDIRLIVENVEIAKSCSSNEEYLRKMIFPQKDIMLCKMGLNCYYPDERF